MSSAGCRARPEACASGLLHVGIHGAARSGKRKDSRFESDTSSVSLGLAVSRRTARCGAVPRLSTGRSGDTSCAGVSRRPLRAAAICSTNRRRREPRTTCRGHGLSQRLFVRLQNAQELRVEQASYSPSPLDRVSMPRCDPSSGAPARRQGRVVVVIRRFFAPSRVQRQAEVALVFELATVIRRSVWPGARRRTRARRRPRRLDHLRKRSGRTAAVL